MSSVDAYFVSPLINNRAGYSACGVGSIDELEAFKVSSYTSGAPRLVGHTVQATLTPPLSTALPQDIQSATLWVDALTSVNCGFVLDSDQSLLLRARSGDGVYMSTSTGVEDSIVAFKDGNLAGFEQATLPGPPLGAVSASSVWDTTPRWVISPTLAMFPNLTVASTSIMRGAHVVSGVVALNCYASQNLPFQMLMTQDISSFQITNAVPNGVYKIFMRCLYGPHTLSCVNGCLNTMSGDISCANGSTWILEITCDTTFCYLTVTNYIDHNTSAGIPLNRAVISGPILAQVLGVSGTVFSNAAAVTSLVAPNVVPSVTPGVLPNAL